MTRRPTPNEVICVVCEAAGIASERLFERTIHGALRKGGSYSFNPIRAACSKMMRSHATMSYVEIAYTLGLSAHSCALTGAKTTDERAMVIYRRASQLWSKYAESEDEGFARRVKEAAMESRKDREYLRQRRAGEGRGNATPDPLFFAEDEQYSVGDAKVCVAIDHRPTTEPRTSAFVVIKEEAMLVGAAVCKEAGIHPDDMYARGGFGRLRSKPRPAQARSATAWLLHHRLAMDNIAISEALQYSLRHVQAVVDRCDADPETMQLAEAAWARLERYKAKQGGVDV